MFRSKRSSRATGSESEENSEHQQSVSTLKQRHVVLRSALTFGVSWCCCGANDEVNFTCGQLFSEKGRFSFICYCSYCDTMTSHTWQYTREDGI